MFLRAREKERERGRRKETHTMWGRGACPQPGELRRGRKNPPPKVRRTDGNGHIESEGRNGTQAKERAEEASGHLPQPAASEF